MQTISTSLVIDNIKRSILSIYFIFVYTYIAGKTFILFHKAFILLVDFENFADAVRGRLSLQKYVISLFLNQYIVKFFAK